MVDNGNIMLNVRNIKKSFGKRNVLKGASLEIRSGEIVALLGTNGAGKTTLVRILSSLLSADQGDISFFGKDINIQDDFLRHRIGLVSQDSERSAYARLTVFENLLFFGRLRGMSRSLLRKRIAYLAERFRFTPYLNRQFGTLSGGQKQSVVIMRALLHDPPLILLDEPTKGLDPVIADSIRSYLKGIIRQEGKSLLLTSHILSEVEDMADRICFLENGVVTRQGSAEELKTRFGIAGFFVFDRRDVPEHLSEALLDLECTVCREYGDKNDLYFGVDDFRQGMKDLLSVLNDDYSPVFTFRPLSLDDAFRRYTARGGSHEFNRNV